MRTMYMKQIIVLLSVVYVTVQAWGQEIGELKISASRPGMATGVDVMPQGRLQWETGVGVEGTDSYTAWIINTSLFRYGLSSSAEIQLGVDVKVEDGDAGIAPIVIGVKTKMYDSENWLPNIGFYGTLTLPVASECFQPDYAAPKLYLLFGHEIGDKWGLDCNVGTEWDGSEPQPKIFAAVCASCSVTDKWGVFAESYNCFSRGDDPECYTDFGATFMPNNRVQFDLSAGLNFNSIGEYISVGLGLSLLL